MFETGKAPYPVERTMFTSGILDLMLESRFQGYKKLDTPELAKVRYPDARRIAFLHEGLGARRQALGYLESW